MNPSTRLRYSEMFTTATALASERTRHLLRLWLKIEDDRPIAEAILERAKIYERIHRERSGRVPASVLAGV